MEALKELNVKNEVLKAKLMKLEAKKGTAIDGGRSEALTTQQEALASCVFYQNSPNSFGKETSIKY